VIVTQHMFVNAYRRFGTAYWSHPQGPSMSQAVVVLNGGNVTHVRQVFLPEWQ
jgi:hypothetical protein